MFRVLAINEIISSVLLFSGSIISVNPRGGDKRSAGCLFSSIFAHLITSNSEFDEFTVLLLILYLNIVVNCLSAWLIVSPFFSKPAVDAFI